MSDSRLLENAVSSIQLGVEDYQSNDPRRPFSAARNFFAGILLLAKEVLVKAAPDADPDLILAAKTKPVSDGAGGIHYEPVGKQTIDFTTLGDRLKDFGIDVDQTALNALNKIRNDIEHKYTLQPAAAVREAISKAFPVVIDLCRELGTTPLSLLGEAWPTMIGVNDVYRRELSRCVESFNKVSWNSRSMSEVVLVCPYCDSELVMQDNATNADHELISATCQSCDSSLQSDKLVVHSVEKAWEDVAYSAALGEAATPVHDCPNCGLATYLTVAGYRECAWCGESMGECAFCEIKLTPENVAWDEDEVCSYCAYKMSKDD